MMEFWTRHDEQSYWKEWPDPMQGLETLLATSKVEVLLVDLRPDEDLASTVATVHLIRKLAGSAVKVTIASPYPSREWARSLEEAGADHVWLIERPGSSRPRRSRQAPPPAVEVEDAICPALHVRTSGDTTISVCGCHRDRMVLAPHHFQRWCLHDYSKCPHWQESRDA